MEGVLFLVFVYENEKNYFGLFCRILNLYLWIIIWFGKNYGMFKRNEKYKLKFLKTVYLLNG